VSPQRRTALVSVGAAVALISIKLAVGLASGSLGLVSEALHSGTDLVAAMLTFFAIGVAGRPADAGHQYGHGKAEHLSALAEAAVLALVSVAVAVLALARLGGTLEQEVETAWWVFAAVGVVLALDVSRYADASRPAERGSGLYYSIAAVLDAYEVLRQLIDATDELEYCFIGVLAAPELLSDEQRGLRRYQALYLRVSDEVRDRYRPNPLSALVRLQ